jgi:hypothetical protein
MENFKHFWVGAITMEGIVIASEHGRMSSAQYRSIFGVISR